MRDPSLLTLPCFYEVVMRSLRTAVLLALAAIIIVAVAIGISRTRQPAPVAQSDLLVSTDWLAERLETAGIVTLHIGRDSARYLEGHIPGARFLPIARFVVEREGLPNELPPVEDLVVAFQTLGISNDTRVILYGDFRGLWAARVFFTLDYLGLGNRTAMLDGGLETWRAESRPTTVALPSVTPGRLSVSAQPSLVVGGDWVHNHLDAPAIRLLDARPPNQYRGDEPGGEIKRPGHIPGAVSLYWEDALESKKRPVLRDLETLRALYRDRGFAPGDTIVTYCRTGIQASHAYFVARVLESPLTLYDASYLEWSNLTSYPVERGAAE
jgi:thiosulfate/3-mercaptopyruvate sulfurtransferase